MILIIDNYDSFTYNLVQYIGSINPNLEVHRNDKIALAEIRAMDPDNGKQLWQFTTRGRVDSSPVIIGNRVYVGGSDGRIYGLDLKSGKPTWEYETGDGFVGSAAIAAGRLVIASDEGTVYCFGEKK